MGEQTAQACVNSDFVNNDSAPKVWAHNKLNWRGLAVKRIITAVAVASLVSLISVPSNACSLAGCLNHGVEANQYFTVMVKHDGKPLAGVLVEITGEGKEQFSGLTPTDGKIRLNLSPGHYWIKAELLGISVAYDCFHINQRSSKSAKRKFNYEWGDLAPATRRIAGKLIDSQPRKDGTPLWNLLHRIDVPITGAALKLQDPVTGSAYTTMSDSSGGFVFDSIPPTTYVLHIEGGVAGDRDRTEFLYQAL